MLVDCIVSGSITVTLFSLYAIYTDADYVLKVDEIVYGTSLIIGALTILVLPPTLYQMSNLTFKVKSRLYKICLLHPEETSKNLDICDF